MKKVMFLVIKQIRSCDAANDMRWCHQNTLDRKGWFYFTWKHGAGCKEATSEILL